MATIALYANKINQMPGMINEVKRAVTDYKSELLALKMKTLTINKSVCNLDDVIRSIQASTQIQDEKVSSLELFYQNSERFITEVVSTDEKAADIIRQRKNDFYEEYSYLKPECEKEWLEQAGDWFVSVGEWCKERWKAAITIIIVAASVIVIVAVPAAAPILIAAAKGAIFGAVTGGLMGGLTSLALGGSFLEGLENGAFMGAISGIIAGGMTFGFTKGVEGVRLTLGQCIGVGTGGGAGSQFLSDIGDIFIKKEKISFGEVIFNTAIAGGIGGIFGAVGYGASKGWSALKLKIGGGKRGRYFVGDATFMDADDAFASNISRRTDVDANGYFDVIAHGTPNGIQITHNGQHMIVDHRTAALLIQNSDGYNGQAIRLLACNTGALDNGFAQNLANKLNVEVYAPTNYLWSTLNGNYFVAGMNNSRLPDMNDVGIFKLFLPGGN